MKYYIQRETVEHDNGESTEKNILYGNKFKIGYVRYIDYGDNGRHGYGIRVSEDPKLKTLNLRLLQMFQSEARKQFPNSENPYICFLDTLFQNNLQKGAKL